MELYLKNKRLLSTTHSPYYELYYMFCPNLEFFSSIEHPVQHSHQYIDELCAHPAERSVNVLLNLLSKVLL